MNSRRNLANNDFEPFYSPGGVEIRSNPNGGKVIFGYWARYNQRSNELRTSKGVKFVEIIRPGAFDRTDFSGIEARFNHENIIAAPPTLRYGFDSVGAYYEIDFDEQDPDHVAVMRKIERGDAKGSSFEFSPPGPNDQRVTDEAGIKLREIISIPKVYEFGPVISPAYPRTTPFVRSLDQWHDEDLQAQQDFEKRKLAARKFVAGALS